MTSMEERCAPYRGRLIGEPFASIVPGRWQSLKYHGSLGPAKAAVGYRERGNEVRGGEIYRRTPQGWELMFRVEARTSSGELPWQSTGVGPAGS